MRTYSMLVVLGVVLGCAGPATEVCAADGAAKSSFKGWELYVRRDGKEDTFSLLPGTNRLKTAGEIRKAGAVGIDAAKARLAELAKGQTVVILGRERGEAPPRDVADDLVEYGKQRGLVISAAR